VVSSSSSSSLSSSSTSNIIDNRLAYSAYRDKNRFSCRLVWWLLWQIIHFFSLIQQLRGFGFRGTLFKIYFINRGRVSFWQLSFCCCWGPGAIPGQHSSTATGTDWPPGFLFVGQVARRRVMCRVAGKVVFLRAVNPSLPVRPSGRFKWKKKSALAHSEFL
jgi:hypothetical protein